jgi:ER lumen protein retaining receptor
VRLRCERSRSECLLAGALRAVDASGCQTPFLARPRVIRAVPHSAAREHGELSRRYNWVMKIIFITSAIFILYLMRFKKPICNTYDARSDNFPLAVVIVPCFILALFINEEFSVTEVLWAFSIYLEAVAILPQLVVVHAYAKEQGGFVENLTSHYVFTLGGYRLFYLFNWIYRALTEPGYRNWIVWVSGIIQTLIYCDFFWYYIRARLSGGSMVLPI